MATTFEDVMEAIGILKAGYTTDDEHLENLIALENHIISNQKNGLHILAMSIDMGATIISLNYIFEHVFLDTTVGSYHDVMRCYKFIAFVTDFYNPRLGSSFN